MYPRYGGRGIQCFLTPAECKFVWVRDQGGLMSKPTLDRYPSNDGHYELSNVRFIEKRLNYSAEQGPSWES